MRGRPMPPDMTRRAGVVIPARNHAAELARLLPALAAQIPPENILVVDSASSDATADVARGCGCRCISIALKDFDHGTTRNFGARSVPGEFIVFMTPDAVPEGPATLAALLEPFQDPSVGATYARQLPRPGARPLERFAREFNYPPEPRVQSLESLPRLGIKAFFLSDSCAAYRREVFERMGSFPEPCVVSEDLYMAARMVLAGFKVCYTPAARVVHSHRLSLWAQFRRNYKIGAFFHDHRWIRDRAPLGAEGLRFLKSECAYLIREGAAFGIVEAILDAGARWTGLHVGQAAAALKSAWPFARRRMSARKNKEKV